MTLSPALKINFKFNDTCLMTGKEMGHVSKLRLVCRPGVTAMLQKNISFQDSTRWIRCRHPLAKQCYTDIII